MEVDAHLAKKLITRLGGAVEVMVADIRALALPRHAYRVIGNIPFSITTEIVRKLVTDPSPPEDAWLVVQRETAWRLCGRPYTQETLSSLRLKPRWHIEIVDHLRRSDFDPSPRVDCVFLWMARRGRPLASARETEAYNSVLSSVFGSLFASPARPILSGDARAAPVHRAIAERLGKVRNLDA